MSENIFFQNDLLKWREELIVVHYAYLPTNYICSVRVSEIFGRRENDGSTKSNSGNYFRQKIIGKGKYHIEVRRDFDR